MRRLDSGSKRQIYIHIGEYHVSRRPEIISTVVGSCVAVCLFDADSGIAGMNHILLPGSIGMADFSISAKYGMNAMELLIAKMMKLGADRNKIIAKAFGGACTLSAMDSKNHIGKKNADFVVKFLEKEGLKLSSCSLGGVMGRKVNFHTDTGSVFIKRIIPSAIKSVVDEEKKKGSTILSSKIREII